jgi:nucleoid DNA-binding protein
MAKSKKALIQNLASKYNLPLKTVTDIIESQFKYVGKVMEEGKFEAVRLPYFGKFSVKGNRVKHLDNTKKQKDGLTNNK